MIRLILLGSGKIGSAIAALLSRTGDYRITVADRDQESLQRISLANVHPLLLKVDDPDSLRAAIIGHAVVVSALPFHLTPVIAAAARDAGAHYFDLTEDVESTKAVRRLAADAGTAFVPQCGLAPGFISIVAHDMTKSFDQLRDVHMRVGALPVYPTNALKYNLTWSTDGLINEYCNPCEAIVGGQLREVPALEEVEHFLLDGIDYEAFNTSGGLGTLAETLCGHCENLNYKTVRYPGHRDIMKTLVQDLRLGQRRDILRNVLESAIPITYQDVVLIFVTVSGHRDGRLIQESFARKIYAAEIAGRLMSAIQITTASSLCAMVDLLMNERLPRQGFVRQEQADLQQFVQNRFGQVFASDSQDHATTGSPGVTRHEPHDRDALPCQ
jgi:saccharopine dehydrogenase-like NADP-dependent oxidoreductase